ncbi:sensor histidine kinase [Bauldia litoralis]|uniref:histidine kinase n=1 Tax=Bauldia litoralis TaxID=665467 RepID=A0A1G6CQH8_9HYPH|nr:ATP-binding protein [Bauldia litoralis]SDB35156.1 PAS domain S-box-containing protein [Bauldia litoralis]
MNGKTHAYLDLAADPAVGAVLLDPRPAFVFRGDGTGILWANAAGVAFFGEAGMGALLDRRFSPSSPTTRGLARLAKTLPLDQPRLEILRFNFGVRQSASPSACRRLDLGGGARGVLAVGSIAANRESLSTRAERLADAIASDNCLVAILDRDARVLGASGGFDALASASGAIDALVDEAAEGDRRVVRTAIAVSAADRPAGVARVAVGDERLFLLIVGPEEARAAATQPEPPLAIPLDEPAATEVAEAPELAAASEPEPAEAVAEAPAALEAAPAAPPPAPSPVRRFLWQSDADHAIAFVSGDLAADVGAANAPSVGEAWRDLASRLSLDGEHHLAEALAGLARFSHTVYWPLAEAPERVAVDLTGVPDFSREGVFRGYRGFGVIRLDDRRPDERPEPAVEPAAPEPETPTPEEQPTVTDDAPVATVVAPPESPEPPEPVETYESPTVPEAPPTTEKAAAPPSFLPPPGADLDEYARAMIEGGRGYIEVPEPGPEDPGDDADIETPADEPAAPPLEATKDPVPVETSNVVHLAKTPTRILPKRLSGSEQDAFRRIAEALGVERENESAGDTGVGKRKGVRVPAADVETPLLNKLPVGIAIYRDARTLFANRMLLDLLGYDTLDAFLAAGGAEAIFPDGGDWATRPLAAGTLRAARSDGSDIAVDAKLHAVNWAGSTALMLSLVEVANPPPPVEETLDAPPAEAPADLVSVEPRIRELEAMLDTATDGVVVIDSESRVDGMNRTAEALFGVEAGEFKGRPFTDLLAEESRKPARDYLDGLASNGVASVLNDGREVIGRVPRGGLIPLFMTIGRLTDSGKYCAVLRDITHWKNVEEELVAARHAAEAANAQKSDFLARISHEIRTPLNAIIGFSEVMMAERFGPVGNDRYKSYLRDIHLSGEHLMSLINDLLDLSKVEAGKLDLNFESVPVNATIQECVALMQPQANRERIIIRTSLSATLPNVVADLRSLRQILLNLLSNAIKFTRAGGQVIVATAIEESGEVVVRIRDTGIGMSDKDIDTAMKPFRQVATSGRMGEGTGLGLPLTKALVEANRATFAIDSVPAQGTLVRITFPTTRVLAG